MLKFLPYFFKESVLLLINTKHLQNKVLFDKTNKSNSILFFFGYFNPTNMSIKFAPYLHQKKPRKLSSCAVFLYAVTRSWPLRLDGPPAVKTQLLAAHRVDARARCLRPLVFIQNKFWVKGDFNCFGVVGVSNPIENPWQIPWPACLLGPYKCKRRQYYYY